jgi:hypothetical protein
MDTPDLPEPSGLRDQRQVSLIDVVGQRAHVALLTVRNAIVVAVSSLPRDSGAGFEAEERSSDRERREARNQPTWQSIRHFL